MLDRAHWINRTENYRKALKLSSAAAVLGTTLVFGSGTAQAQQVTPGIGPECIIIAGEAICEGDLADGITAFPGTPDFDRIIVRNPDAPIAPPGYFGIGLVKDNGDLDIVIEDGVTINVFDDPNIAGPAQGIIAIAQNGFDLSLETDAEITADGNGSFGLGIEAVAEGGGSVTIVNRGDIDAFTSGDSAIALQGRSDSSVTINNSGTLSASSDGTGERSTATAGILAIVNGLGGSAIVNSGDISVATGAASFDTDFDGIGGAIVANTFTSGASNTSIVNSGDLTAIGPQTHGIVAFVQRSSGGDGPGENNDNASASVVSEGTITINGSGSYGILAQGAGSDVNLNVTSNSDIEMTNIDGTATGIFVLNQAQAGVLQNLNAGNITGSGDNLRGLGVSTFGAMTGGDYIFETVNMGDITLDTALGFGITNFATLDDNVVATVDNSGDIDLASTTNADSIGISVNFAAVDAAATGDGDSSVTITNSGDITMGAGNAIFAAADNVVLTNTGNITHTPDGSDVVLIGGTGSSQNVDLIFRDHEIISESFTPSADYFAVQFEDALAPSQYTVSFDNVMVRSNEGGISFGSILDDSNLSLTAVDLTMQIGGSDTPGILVEQFGDGVAAEFNLDRTSISLGSSNTSAIDIAEIGEGSALTFNISNSAVFAAGGTDTPVVILGGLGGANSAINVNIVNTGFAFADSTTFEIAKFAQQDSVSVFTVGGDSLFDVRRADGFGIAVGTADVGPIDNFSSTIVIEDSRVVTFGDRSTGIFVDSKMDGVANSDFGILVSGVDIDTNGESAHGIEIIGAQNATLGDRDNIAAGGAFSDIVIEASENIIAAGANSDAIRITNQDRTSIRVAEGATVSGGTGDAVAIRLAGAEADSGLADQITASATVTKARLADRAANLITTYNNSRGMVTTSAVGGGASGLDPITFDPVDLTGADTLVEVDNATVESMMGAGAIVADGSLAVGGSNGAIIRTGEDDAAVISAVEALALLASDTTLSSTGDNAPLLDVRERAAGDGTFVLAQLTDVTAITTGANSDALALGGGVSDSVGVLFLTASDLAAPSVVSTTGDGSSAISFDAPDGSTFTGAISRSEVSTTGAEAAAILLNTGDMGSTSLELLDTLVTTSGDGSDVLRLNTGDTTDYNFIIADSELRSEGDDSALIRVTGREGTNGGTFVMIGGTLASVGDNSAGIDYRDELNGGGSSHAFFIAESVISTEGDNSAGFVFSDGPTSGANIASYTLDAVEISTLGANSDAFSTGGLGPVSGGSISTAIITNSTFATEGDNSRAFHSESVGSGSAQSVVLVDSSFTTLGEDSTAILINDRSAIDPDFDLGFSVVSIDIDNVSVSTQGNNSRGIDVASLLGDVATSVVGFSALDVITAGDNSDAIAIGSALPAGNEGFSSTVSIELSDIATQGDDSRGIFINTIGDGAIRYIDEDLIDNQLVDPDLIELADSTVFVADNTISTMGARSHGIEFAGSSGDILDATITVVEASDTITTMGDGAIGLVLGDFTGAFLDLPDRPSPTSLTVTFAPLSITTSGDASHGMQIGNLPAFDVADTADVVLGVVSRTVTTTGDGAHGIIIGSGWGEAGSTLDDNRTGANRYAIVDITGDISVSGAGSDGVVSSSFINEFSIDTDGSITSADGFALNFEAVDDGQTAINLGTIDGDVIFGDGDDTLDSSGVLTGNIDMGAGTNSIFIREGGLLNSLDTVLLGTGNAITIEGDISPGGVGPIQVTNVGSDLVFSAGSQFLIDIDGMAADTNAAGFFQSDRVVVDGDITINGGTLVVESLTPEGDFDRQAQFLILDAAGTVTGEFADLMADLPFLELNLTYNAGNVILNAGRQGPVVPFASLGLTPNQRAVGVSFDALEPNAMGDLDDVIDQLIFSSTDQALTAFDTTSGEIYASLLAQAGNDGLRRSRETLARARSAANSGWGIWGGIASSDSSTDGDGNGAAVDQNDFGFDFGIDYVGEENAWAAGLSTGWRDGSLDVPGRLSTADYETWYLAGHARYGTGGQGVTVTAAIDFAETDAGVERTLTVNGISRNALGNADMDTLAIGGEARYGVSVSDDWAIGPVVSVIHTDSDLSLDNETGAGGVALSSSDASDRQTRFGVGAFANFQSDNAGFDLSGQYVDASSNTVGARLAFADGGNAPFTVLAPVTDGSGFLTSASARIDLGSGVALSAQVDALFGGDVEEVNGSLVLGWRF